jgi:inner membrane protein
MNRALLFKSLIVASLILLILIPLGLVSNTVQERKSSREDAVQSVIASYAGPQTLTGPVLVIPYKEVIRAPDNTQHTDVKQMLVFPKTLSVKAEVTPNERYRGIFKVLVYEMQSRWEGTIAMPDLRQLRPSAGHVSFDVGQPFIALGVSDIRGLMAVPTLNIGGKDLTMERGTQLASLKQGLHADIDLAADKAGEGERTVPFALTIPLLGAQSLSFTPVAGQNDISLSSPWRHPSFNGTFLPRTRTVSAGGFRANWSVTSYNTTARDQIAGSDDAPMESMSVTLIDPVNVYVQTDRAVKYGVLFVLLTFAGFFMFELVKRLRIHPIQYLLVGLSLALFFLLLLSLSEHLVFSLAYLVASAACIGLLGFYLSFVLHSWKRGLGFAVALSALYAALYGLLLSEDNALILGSILLFAILAAIMVLTRRIDWYAVGDAWQPLRDRSPTGVVEATAASAHDDIGSSQA